MLLGWRPVLLATSSNTLRTGRPFPRASCARLSSSRVSFSLQPLRRRGFSFFTVDPLIFRFLSASPRRARPLLL